MKKEEEIIDNQEYFLYLETLEEQNTIEFEIENEDDDPETNVEVVRAISPAYFYRNPLETEDCVKIPVDKETYESNIASVVIVLFEDEDEVKIDFPIAMKSRRAAKKWADNLEFNNICENVSVKPWENKNIQKIFVCTINIEN